MVFIFFFAISWTTGLRSSVNCCMVSLLLLYLGGRYILPRNILSLRPSPLTSTKRPSQRLDFLYKSYTLYSNRSNRYINKPPCLPQFCPISMRVYPGIWKGAKSSDLSSHVSCTHIALNLKLTDNKSSNMAHIESNFAFMLCALMLKTENFDEWFFRLLASSSLGI